MSEETTAGAATAAEGGRELTVGIAVLAGVVAVTSLLTGALMAGGALFGEITGPFAAPGPVGQGVVGAAMLGTAPGLLLVGRARTWEEVRTLVLPLGVVLVGLFTVGLTNAGSLQAAQGGPLFLALFSLGWLPVLGVLALGAVVCIGRQYARRAVPLRRRAPLPGWSKPFLAVLGSSWLGIGAGLLVLPGFWSDFVPWRVGRADAQALGVWALAMGVGVLGALVDDDLGRGRPALVALPGVAVAVGVVLAANASDVDWASGPGCSLVTLIGGLLVAGVAGCRMAPRE
ncbi:hypothetical protein [Streptomyces sp. NPDC089919]|uniref:hypothetical protein n=1 Tax=Streptomyces sp. NPDC089919 TaxID=3155188 RepID=UPI0034446B96